MSIDELCALPVAELAAKDSALFMWATFPQLPEALRLIRAWGFTYKSVAFVWLKKNKKADVTLENFNLSHVPVYMMSEEQLSMYALYMSTLGNRPDLFPSSGYIGKYITNRPPEHEVPESYLDDETFAAILKEAEKYLGFPYVWGGSSPSTSFDCSGFVSYVYNQCGWDFGRLGAQGLYNICSRTSSPRPGDLVFFVGTYDTAGISHVGIYVGDGWMLHCGDPISYANLNSSYWQSHLYAYGRLP